MDETSRHDPERMNITADPQHSKQALSSWLSVVQAYNLCDSTLGRLLAEQGYTLAQYELVVRLKREPDQTQQALANQCFQAKSGVSMLLKSLEEEGWVMRSSDEGDARVKRLRLTQRGHAHAKRMLQVQTRVISTMVQGFSEDEIAQLQHVMEKVSRNLLLLA
jgi:DNA-binding MarR family transcriptional regulator